MNKNPEIFNTDRFTSEAFTEQLKRNNIAIT
jgi:hypothetical protein